MPTGPKWLDPREDRAWRAFIHAHHRLAVQLSRLLLEDSGLTQADYEILAVLSEHPAGSMPARELCTLVQWEKSRLSHQVRHLQEQGLAVRESNPADGRSAVIRLLPAGRRAIEDAAPQHVHNVRRDFIDLFTPAELDTLAALNERILRHLAEEPLSGHPGRAERRGHRRAAPADRARALAAGISGPVSRRPSKLATVDEVRCRPAAAVRVSARARPMSAVWSG
jgi:DNA-binding MarR family transcriptional regulator